MSYRIPSNVLLYTVLFTLFARAQSSTWTPIPYKGQARYDFLSDRDIESAIQNVLKEQFRIPPGMKMDIQVKKGVVLLSGVAPSLLFRERPAALSQQIKGVRSVVNKIIVSHSALKDSELKNRVDIALSFDPAASNYPIKVTVKKAKAMLTGQVPSYQARAAVKEAVMNVFGIQAVNDSEIKILPNFVRNDSEIESEIRSRIQSDAWLVNASQLKVSVKNSQVTLSGKVATPSDYNRMMNYGWTRGVKGVDTTQLKTEPALRVSLEKSRMHMPLPDALVQRAVLDSFKYTPRLALSEPIVGVHQQVVTLSGPVIDERSKQLAVEIAQSAAGVAHVKNLMTILQPKKEIATSLSSKLRAALDTNPSLKTEEIVIAVYADQVYLGGIVSNVLQKQLAEKIAQNLPEIKDVTNNILVVQ